MPLLENGAFMDHLEQSKVEAKQQVNSLIDAIYAKLLLDLELWLNKHESKKRNDSSVQQLGVNHDVNENVISPLLRPPSHLQSHSNHFTVKSEIDSEENVTEHNLPGTSPNCQSTPPEPLQSTHSITPHSSSLSIVKEKIVDKDYNFDNDVEVNSQVIQNEQSANDPAYLQVHNEFCQETMPNMTYTGFPEFYGLEVSNRLLPNALTHQPREYNQDRMHFGDDLEIDQEALDEVKRETEDEENMKRRENELEAGDIRPNEEGDRMESEEAEDNQATNVIGNDHVQHNSDVSVVIQQNQNNTNNAIEDKIVNESIANPIQSNLVQRNHQFQCAHCPKSFHHKCRFEQHLLVHTGERPFACDQCTKAYKYKAHLTQHKRIHQNIKPYQCDQCDKQFVLKIQLDSHLRTHSGEKPYKCNFCDKSFSESSTRSRHEQSKHLHVKPYRCKVCGQSATERSMIIKHIRMVHFGLPKTIKKQRERNIIDHRDPKELVEKIVISSVQEPTSMGH